MASADGCGVAFSPSVGFQMMVGPRRYTGCGTHSWHGASRLPKFGAPVVQAKMAAGDAALGVERSPDSSRLPAQFSVQGTLSPGCSPLTSLVLRCIPVNVCCVGSRDFSALRKGRQLAAGRL